MRRKLLFFILMSSALLWCMNAFAEKYDLYFVTTWFDGLSHFVGGIVVALVALYIFHTFKISPRLSNILFFVFVVGTAWEFFELYISSTSTSKPGYFLDTASDLIVDLLGASVVCMMANKNNV